jgi:hypothetical protein
VLISPEHRSGGQKTMSTPTREGFYVLMAYIDKLVRYADSGDYSDDMLPHLDSDMNRYLKSPEGQAAVSVWRGYFSDTIRLLRLFRDEDLRGPKRKPKADLNAAFHAASSALDALEHRLRGLATRYQLA